MKKNKWLLFLGICAILLLSGAGITMVSNGFFVSEQTKDVKQYVEEETRKISPEHFMKEIQKEITNQGITVQKLYNPNDTENINKWMIRIKATNLLYPKGFFDNHNIEEQAREEMAFAHMFIQHAKEEYDITYTDKQVDDWITNNPDLSADEYHIAYAKGLGLSLYELNHEFDRDLYEKNMVWELLMPKIAERYQIPLNDPSIQAHNVALTNYEHEVRSKLK